MLYDETLLIILPLSTSVSLNMLCITLGSILYLKLDKMSTPITLPSDTVPKLISSIGIISLCIGIILLYSSLYIRFIQADMIGESAYLDTYSKMITDKQYAISMLYYDTRPLLDSLQTLYPHILHSLDSATYLSPGYFSSIDYIDSLRKALVVLDYCEEENTAMQPLIDECRSAICRLSGSNAKISALWELYHDIKAIACIFILSGLILAAIGIKLWLSHDPSCFTPSSTQKEPAEKHQSSRIVHASSRKQKVRKRS